jgi:hypothetical protein
VLYYTHTYFLREHTHPLPTLYIGPQLLCGQHSVPHSVALMERLCDYLTVRGHLTLLLLPEPLTLLPRLLLPLPQPLILLCLSGLESLHSHEKKSLRPYLGRDDAWFRRQCPSTLRAIEVSQTADDLLAEIVHHFLLRWASIIIV